MTEQQIEILRQVREAILDGSKVENGTIMDTLWMPNTNETVVDALTHLIGDEGGE